MGFFNIIGLLALLGVPAVIILHMLKQKQKDVKIPSTFLWERAVDTSVQSKPWQKLKKSLPLILQLIAAAALGLGVAAEYIFLVHQADLLHRVCNQQRGAGGRVYLGVVVLFDDLDVELIA